VVFISGIGCAARFPYYVATYGFHTIHGRAPAVATGVKLADPNLDVWVVGGDGDFLSIGGNHVLHALRRNVDLNLLLLNNAIYGLTKGQYSPTSPVGTRSPSTPNGSVERPVNAALLALGAGAGFVARTVDSMQDHLPKMLVKAHAHRGTSLVEILQNCIIYFDGAFGPLGEKTTAADAGIRLVHGEPMLFGRDREKGLVFDATTCRFRVVTVGVDAPLEAVARHDETSLARATALADLGPGAPVALGMLYQRPLDAAHPGYAELAATPALRRDQLATLLARGKGA
jgi:2-oxoglutarate ferredoxin oxidoreductase subunit beta